MQIETVNGRRKWDFCIYRDDHTPYSCEQIYFKFKGCQMFFSFYKKKRSMLWADSADLDRTLRSAASDLGLHCLPVSSFRDTSK